MTEPAPSHTAAGLRACLRIAQAWGLSAEEQTDILRAEDQAERLSHVLGIYGALHTLFPSDAQAHAWVRKPNSAGLFGGQTALEVMRQGLPGLRAVRAYLAAECGAATPPGAHDRRREFLGQGPQA